MALRHRATRLLHVGVALIAAGVMLSAAKAEAPVNPSGDTVYYTKDQAAAKSGEAVSVSISIMLLGSISFMMGLFYLVNSDDEDIQRYAWKVVSATISIFCAVLLFQAFNGIVEEYVITDVLKACDIEEESPEGKIWECVVDILQLVIWLTIMQIVLADSSGAIAEMSEWFFQPKNMEEVEVRLKSYAVLLAHISGFAALNAWGSIQQNMLSFNPLTTTLILPIGVIGLFGLYKCYEMVRVSVALGDDGEVDENEQAWIDETQDAEDDVAGLSLSFLTVQVLRFAISGDLPDEEGKEPHAKAYHHSGSECMRLILFGFVFLAGLMVVLNVRVRCFPKSPEEVKSERKVTEKEMEKAEEEYKKWENVIRPFLILIVYFSCGMAWCFFYGTLWIVAATGWTDQDAMLQVIVAIIISGASFSVIWCFDKIEDAGVLGEQASHAINATIDALGILIGFSWEQSFDVAVDTISESVDKYVPKTFGRLIMSFALTAIVFPAWKNYILPEELKLKEEATGVGKLKKSYAVKLDKHHSNFLEEEVEEWELDHSHMVLKLHRRRHHDKSMKCVKEGEKTLKHMIFTTEGLRPLASNGEGENELLEQLLPRCLNEPEENAEESRLKAILGGAVKKVQQMSFIARLTAGAKDGETRNTEECQSKEEPKEA